MSLPDLQLHHVGFVVEEIESAMPGFARSVLGKWDGRIWEDPGQGAKVAFLEVTGGAPQIELVEPWGEGSPVRAFLAEHGGGLHHVCYQVAELDSQLARLRIEGALTVRPPMPAVAFGGRRIAWVMTRQKLLIEFLEAPR